MVHPMEGVILCVPTTISCHQISNCSRINRDQNNMSVVWTSRIRALQRNRKKNKMTVRMSQPYFKRLQKEKIRQTGSYMTFKPSTCVWQEDLPPKSKKALASWVPSQALWLFLGKWSSVSEHTCVVTFYFHTLILSTFYSVFFPLCLLSSSSLQNQNRRQKTVIKTVNCPHRLRGTQENINLWADKNTVRGHWIIFLVLLLLLNDLSVWIFTGGVFRTVLKN